MPNLWNLLRIGSLASLSVAGLLPLSAATTASPPGARSPNIILILADDLGYGDLGCFGSKHISTPHLDRLASEGTRFTAAYAGAPVCAPSRNVLMTGLHTGHGLIRNNSPRVGGTLEPYANGAEGGMRLSLRAEDLTVATALKQAGYATGIAGKWGLGEEGTAGTPTRHGFDEWLGYLNQNHAAYYYTDYLDATDGRRLIPENRDEGRRVYSNDLLADFGVDFIRRRAGEPFFLYLPFTVPHNRMEVPELGDYARRDWPEDARIYAAMVTRLDGYVGRIVAELEKLGLSENTLIVFTSDNGPLKAPRATLLGSAGGLRGFKGSVYEGGIRVPMIARWKGRIPAGRTSAEPWSFVDFFPTCAELAGFAPPARLDGRSVLPLLTGVRETLGERALYWEIPDKRLHQALRRGRWKAVRAGLDQPPELYDLAADPTESINRAAQHPDIAGQLAREMDHAHIPSPHWPVN